MKTFTSRELAEELDVKVHRLKRWARDLLGVDESAGMRMGYSREFSPNEAFFLWMARTMIQHLQIPIKEVSQILKDLEPWLQEKRLLPETPRDLKTDPEEPVQWTNWVVEIVNEVGEYYCQAKGLIDRSSEGGIVTERYTLERIGQHPQLYGDDVYNFYGRTITILDVSAELYTFLFLQGSWEQWCEQTGRLCVEPHIARREL